MYLHARTSCCCMQWSVVIGRGWTVRLTAFESDGWMKQTPSILSTTSYALQLHILTCASHISPNPELHACHHPQLHPSPPLTPKQPTGIPEHPPSPAHPSAKLPLASSRAAHQLRQPSLVRTRVIGRDTESDRIDHSTARVNIAPPKWCHGSMSWRCKQETMLGLVQEGIKMW